MKTAAPKKAGVVAARALPSRGPSFRGRQITPAARRGAPPPVPAAMAYSEKCAAYLRVEHSPSLLYNNLSAGPSNIVRGAGGGRSGANAP